jgi:hypothetical protein
MAEAAPVQFLGKAVYAEMFAASGHGRSSGLQAEMIVKRADSVAGIARRQHAVRWAGFMPRFSARRG